MFDNNTFCAMFMRSTNSEVCSTAALLQKISPHYCLAYSSLKLLTSMKSLCVSVTRCWVGLSH